MIRALSDALRHWVERYLPDAFALTAILTLLVFAMGLVITGESADAMIGHWYGGFWNFLTFAMQMTLIIITGYCLAMAPAVQRGLDRLAQKATTAQRALLITMAVTALASFISWGLGFVLGPILARAIARRNAVDFPLLVAAAYCAAICTLPMGLSITAPVLVNTPGHFLEAEIGLIPQSETIFSPVNISTVALALLGSLLVFRKMVPAADQAITIVDEHTGPVEVVEAPQQRTLSQRISDSRWLSVLVVLGGLYWLLRWFRDNGFDLNINILNFVFLMVGLGLHGSMQRYANCFTEGVKSASGIILQYPFYAGIMGMMQGSGLVVVVAQWMAAVATPATFGFITMLSAGLVNIVVPSGGGQWAIQGPILVESARQLGVPVTTAINAFTVGDLWTNLFQPFFALPALGISGLGLRDIWGYCLMGFIVFGIAGTIGTLLVPLLIQ